MTNILLTNSYNIIKNLTSEDKQISFNELWKEVVKVSNISEANAENQIGNFYTDLLESPEFILTENKLWTIREFVTKDQFNKISNLLFINHTNIVEEDFKKHMSKTEIEEMESEKEVSDITPIITSEEE